MAAAANPASASLTSAPTSPSRSAQESQQPQHVVFMNMVGTGHVNPTLPVVAELRRRNIPVTYFVEDTLRSVVEAAGATWRPFRHPGCSAAFTGVLHGIDEDGVKAFVPEGTPREAWDTLPAAVVYNAWRVLPNVLEDLRSLQPAPSVIVYEPFLAFPLVAAHVLQVPAVGFLTMTGPGVMALPTAASDAIEQQPWVQEPRQRIKETYGVDVLKHGMFMEYYSPMGNLTLTLQELFSPPTTERQLERFGDFPFACMGPMVDASVTRIAHAGLHSSASEKAKSKAGPVPAEVSATPAIAALPLGVPTEQIARARQEGRQVLYVSLGTVATGRSYWAEKFGVVALQNNGCPEGGRPLSEHTGKEFCQHFWRTCFAAFGDDERIFVVMTLGPNDDALEDMPPAPANFALRQAVPQLEMLGLCDAMITHGGCNSMHEALLHGVPLAAVPIFGDQPTNGTAVEDCGAGVSFPHPLRSATADALRGAVTSLLDASESNIFRVAAAAMSEKLRATKGAPAAADAVLASASLDNLHRLGGS